MWSSCWQHLSASSQQFPQIGKGPESGIGLADVDTFIATTNCDRQEDAGRAPRPEIELVFRAGGTTLIAAAFALTFLRSPLRNRP
jgi:hypothetical protein